MARNITIVVFILMAISAAWLHGGYHRGVIDDLKHTKDIKDAVEAARAQERELQQGANDELKQQNEDLGNISANLAIELERLRRERPTRPALPATPRATCRDANGAELDADHAGFLARYASLAATQDRELETCRVLYNQARDKLASFN